MSEENIIIIEPIPYNTKDWISEGELQSTGGGDINLCVFKSGDTMSGALNLPKMIVGEIEFSDNTIQSSAYDNENVNIINNKTFDMNEYDEELLMTSFNHKLKCDDIELRDIQSLNDTIFNIHEDISNIDEDLIAIQKISYDINNNLTTISDNCLINNLVCNNFDTSFLYGMSSNIQAQINEINYNSAYLSNDIASLLNKTENMNDFSYDTMITEFNNKIKCSDLLTSNYQSINDEIETLHNGNSNLNTLQTELSHKVLDLLTYDMNGISEFNHKVKCSDLITSNYQSINGQLNSIQTQFNSHNDNILKNETNIGELQMKCMDMYDYNEQSQISRFTNKLQCDDIITSLYNSLNITISSLQSQIITLQTQINNFESGIPIGAVISFLGQGATIPTNFMECMGQLLSRTQYPELYSKIGNTYAEGKYIYSGSFYLPDFRTTYLIGSGMNENHNIGGLVLGSFVEQSVQAHRHAYVDSGTTSKSVSTSGLNNTNVADNTSHTKFSSDEIFGTDNLSRNNEFTRPYSYAVKFIIRVI